LAFSRARRAAAAPDVRSAGTAGRKFESRRARHSNPDVRGARTFRQLFPDSAVPRPEFIEQGKRGAEHIVPEDTFDADYGRLLGARVPYSPQGSLYATKRTAPVNVTVTIGELPEVWYRYGDSNPVPWLRTACTRSTGSAGSDRPVRSSAASRRCVHADGDSSLRSCHERSTGCPGDDTVAAIHGSPLGAFATRDAGGRTLAGSRSFRCTRSCGEPKVTCRLGHDNTTAGFLARSDAIAANARGYSFGYSRSAH
jgi:hypothetical protein